MRRVVLHAAVLGLLAAGLLACGNVAPVPIRPSVLPSEASIVYGPETFTRQRGPAVLEAREIALDGFGPPFTLHVRNGNAQGQHRVTSAEVWVDGELVLGDMDFSPRVPGHVVPLEPNGAINLAVRLQGAPGSELTLWVEGEALPMERFYTVWEDGAGQRIERVHHARVGVPTALDVNDVPGADLIATLDFAEALEVLTVTVERAEGATGTLPVLVEAIVPIPGGASLAHEFVALGYDQRASDAPWHFEAYLTPDEAQFGVLLEQQSASFDASLSLLASLFDGGHDQRTNVTALRLDYGFGPSEASANVAFDHALELHLTGPGGGATVAHVSKDDGQALDARLEVIQQPSELTLSLDPGTNAMRYEASNFVDLLHLAVHTPEVHFFGTSRFEAMLLEVPTDVALAFAGDEMRISVEANATLGQLLFAAGDSGATLPARSFGGDPVLGDVVSLTRDLGGLASSLRLTAIEQASISVDPIAIELEQDPARTRSLDINATFDAGSEAVTVSMALDKPGMLTSLQVGLQAGEPITFNFNNSHTLARFALEASGLGGIENANVQLDNVSRRLLICMDQGPACQRPNPHSVQRYATATTTVTSMNFDDFGSHGSGSGPAFRTTLNASIVPIAGAPLMIENLRFRNLGLDIVDANTPHSTNCGTMPRLSAFVDSRSHPFVINRITSAQLEVFRLGTDSNPARASNRIVRLTGWSTSPIIGCLAGPNTMTAGALSSGGQQVLWLNTELGTVNTNSYLGWLVLPLVGGTVPNPQPW